jgi:hypothetical protein
VNYNTNFFLYADFLDRVTGLGREQIAQDLAKSFFVINNAQTSPR